MKIVIDIPEGIYKFIKISHFYDSGRRSGRTIEQIVINGIKNGIPYEEKPQGEWEDYSGDFYKCPECGYLLNKLCPQCHNKVFLPKGDADMRGSRE